MSAAVQPDMVRSYIRDVLERVLGERPDVDDDGDIACRVDDVDCSVRVHGAAEPIVQVCAVVSQQDEQAHVLVEVLSSAMLAVPFVRCWADRGKVVVSLEVWARVLTTEALTDALNAVATSALGLSEALSLARSHQAVVGGLQYATGHCVVAPTPSGGHGGTAGMCAVGDGLPLTGFYL